MKRLFLLLPILLLVFSLGCTDISDIGEWGDENGEEGRTDEKPINELSAIRAEDLMIGFISDSSVDDCDTRLCERALREAILEIGVGEQNFKTMYNVTPGYESTRVAEILISLGCNVIVSVGDELTGGLHKAAENNPDVYFIAAGTDTYGDNMSVYTVDTADLYYLFGAVAATVSDTQRIGYMASLQKESVADINAFALGALSVSSDAAVDVAFSDELDGEYAALLLKQFSVGGCDVAVRHGDCDVLKEYAADSLSAVLDLCACDGTSAPLRITYHFRDLYMTFFDMISSGEWTAVSRCLSFAGGGIEAEILSENFTDDEIQNLSAVIDDIRTEDFEVFSGEIRNNDGAIEIKEGETLTKSEIEKMDYLVFGITGTLPEKDHQGSLSYQSAE